MMTGRSEAALAVDRHTKASAELAALLAGKERALAGRENELAALQRELAALRRELDAAQAALEEVIYYVVLCMCHYRRTCWNFHNILSGCIPRHNKYAAETRQVVLVSPSCLQRLDTWAIVGCCPGSWIALPRQTRCTVRASGCATRSRRGPEDMWECYHLGIFGQGAQWIPALCSSQWSAHAHRCGAGCAAAGGAGRTAARA